MLTGCHYMYLFPLTYMIDQNPSPFFPESTAALFLMLSSGETDRGFETCLSIRATHLAGMYNGNPIYSTPLLQFNVE